MWARTCTVLVITVLFISGCDALSGISLQPDPNLNQESGLFLFPRNRVYTVTGYDLVKQDQISLIGYRVIGGTVYNPWHSGIVLGDQYYGVYVARNAWLNYSVGVYGGRDRGSEQNTVGIAYFKSF